MKNWTIGKRVTTGFATLLVLVIVLAVINFVILQDIRARLFSIYDDAMVGMDLAAEVSFNIGENERLLTWPIRAKTDEERNILEEKIAANLTENKKMLTGYETSIVRSEDRDVFNKFMRASKGVQMSVKVEQSLQEIVAKAPKVDELVAEIAVASKEQSQGVSQVNTAVAQMDKVTQSPDRHAIAWTLLSQRGNCLRRHYHGRRTSCAHLGRSPNSGALSKGHSFLGFLGHSFRRPGFFFPRTISGIFSRHAWQESGNQTFHSEI